MRLHLLSTVAAFCLLFVVQRGICSEEKIFKAGAVAVNINPASLPIHSNGSMTPRFADSVHDDLHARCLVLDNGIAKIALVVCDSCMIPRELLDDAKQLASDRTGIPASHILCSATHSHSAVSVAAVFQSAMEEDYAQLLIEKIAEGIAAANSQLEPAKIGWALGNAPQHVFNRRWFMRPGLRNDDPFDSGKDSVRMNPQPNHRDLLRPAGPTDPQVPVLAIQTLDGYPISVWANYSLHYVGGVPGNGLSADYFGEFARQFSSRIIASQQDVTATDRPSVVVAMTNGTSGDINNVNFFEGTGRQQPFEQIRLVATDLAHAAQIAYERVDYRHWVPLIVAEEEIELKVRKPTDFEVANAKELLSTAGQPPWSDRRQIYANETVQLADYPDTVKIKLQAIRIGDLGITAIPCETFVETGLALKALSPLQPSFTIELANGYNGYLPTPQQHALGGYETWRAKSSYLEVDAEPQIRSTLLKLLGQVASAEKVDGSAISNSDTADAPAISVESCVPAASDGTKLRTQTADALSMIESTRGGRHWVDTPTTPPKTPQESYQCFQIEPGLKLELVAAEPVVFDPVWMTFDEVGRMFVAEYADYPTGPADPQSPPLSRIVMLEDTNNDGMMDRRVLFADHLNFTHSLMPFRGGFLVGTKDSILYLKDTNSDGQADVREVLFSGFQSPHPQMQIGCPQWGIDNWIYFNYGPGKVTRASPELLDALFGESRAGRPRSMEVSSRVGQAELSLPNRDFRFHPTTFEFGPASGFGQFGNTIDARGHRFFCTNRNPIMMAPISPELLGRNRFLAFPEDQYDVAPSGDQSLVFPLIDMKSNYLSHAGTYTAACGTTAYIGDAFGDHFSGSVFVCEPVGNLVTRYIVRPEGSQLVAQRAREKSDFLASTDPWFRPASLTCGPDGSLYLADMSRLWVEHPRFLPTDVADQLDWRAGENQGRIWRIVPSGERITSERFQPGVSPEDWVAMLSHSNGWQRQLAQRLLMERPSEDVFPLLRDLLNDDRNEWAAQRSLWVLHGLHAATAEDVIQGMQSKYSSVRETAVQLARDFLSEPSVLASLMACSRDSDAHVRFQAALSLGDIQNSQSTMAIARVAATDSTQRWTNTAVLTSAAGRSSEILVAMRAMRRRDSSPPHSETVRLVRKLAECTGAQGDRWQLRVLLSFIANTDSPLDWWKLTSLSGLATGLERYQGEDGKLTLQTILEQPPAWIDIEATKFHQVAQGVLGLVLDSAHPLFLRVTATELLSSLPSEEIEPVLQLLLEPSQPGALQVAAIKAMKSLGLQDWNARVIDQWSWMSPQVRAEALSLLLGDSASTKISLQAMFEQRLEAALITIDQRALLLSHPNMEIRLLAQQVLGSGITADRQSVVQEYWPALDLQGDRRSGQAVFDRVCASCHRIEGRGHSVGPDLSDSRNRSREAILIDLLDPNQRIDPQYLAYQILTVDGQVLHGLFLSETSDAIVLKVSGAEERTVRREDIEDLKVSGRSLMPEGVEKDVNLQQMVDLLEFLKPSSQAVHSP